MAEDLAEGRVVLVADDDDVVRARAARALQQAGYRVLKTSDGLETLKVLKRFEPELIVLDIGMPGLDGKAVMRIVRSMRDAPRVVFLTAYDGEDDRREGLSLGAVDYITKPFEPADLVARVGTALAG